MYIYIYNNIHIYNYILTSMNTIFSSNVHRNMSTTKALASWYAWLNGLSGSALSWLKAKLRVPDSTPVLGKESKRCRDASSLVHV